MDLTPMIDVVFQIVIFFLCTMHYRSLEGRLDAFLPHDSGANVSEDRLEEVEVRIAVLEPGQRRSAAAPARVWDGSGRFEFRGRRLEYRVGPRRASDLENLRALLTEVRRDRPDGQCRLAPGRGTVTQDAIAVLDLLLDVGFQAVAIAPAAGTERASPERDPAR